MQRFPTERFPPFNDPYRYLWREETTDWSLSPKTPNHTYITKGQHLYGYIKRNTKDIVWFKEPKKSWSPSRRTFRKFSKGEIDSYVNGTVVLPEVIPEFNLEAFMAA
jgi:hypothetical protein